MELAGVVRDRWQRFLRNRVAIVREVFPFGDTTHLDTKVFLERRQLLGGAAGAAAMRLGRGAMTVRAADAGVVALPLSRVRKNQQQEEGEKCSHGSSLIDVPCFLPNGEGDQCRRSDPQKQLDGEAIH